MPTLWRYLLKNYFKVLLLSFVSFIAILIITRLDHIARYAVLSSQQWKVIAFALYQINYVAPIALPIASLIASIILFQGMSHTQELTALRTAGLSLRRITLPILWCGAILSLLNLYIGSELATQSHLATRKMQNDFMSMNPFVLLKNVKFLKIKGAYIDIDHLSEDKTRAKDVIFAMYDSSRARINMLTAKELILKDHNIRGKNIGIISTFSSHHANDFDQLLIENQDNIATTADGFSVLIKKGSWRINPDHLRFTWLLINIGKYQNMQYSNDQAQANYAKRQLQNYYSDIARRISLGLAVFTFTLMGTAFGIEVSRNRSKKGIIWVIALATLFLACFFSSKNAENNFPLAATIYLAPHVLIVAACVWTLKRVTKGQE